MNAINALLTQAADWLIAPLADFPRLMLLVCSVVTGVLMSIAFRYTSNQKALARVADLGRGHLLAIKLFKDDLPGMFRNLGHIFQCVLLRMWHSLRPALVMLVPLLFLLSQLGLRYEHRPLLPGEAAVIQVQFKEPAWQQCRDTQIEATSGIAVETEPLRDDLQHAIYWRIRATEPGSGTVRWQLGEAAVEKSVVAAAGPQAIRAVSPRRPGTGWWDRLLHPGEPGLDGPSPVEGIIVYYPHRATPILGFDLPWWITFLIASIAIAWMMQPIVKVRY